MQKTVLFLIPFTFLCAFELEPITVEDTMQSSAVYTLDEEVQINAKTLAEKLENSVSINQIGADTNAKKISIRGNNFRATEYYEDGIPLYKTGNGFVDLSMYNDSSLSTTVNAGGSSGVYSVSATGGEIVLNSKKLKSGLHGNIDTSISTDMAYLNSLASYKTDTYYIKVILNTTKQDSFTLSDDFPQTPLQDTKERVNSDSKQTNGYLKMGYKLNNNSNIAFKVSHLKSEFGLPVNIYDEPSNPFATNADYTRMDEKELSSYWLYYDYDKSDFKLSLRAYYDEYFDTFNFYDSLEFTDLISLRLDRNRHKQVVDNDPIEKKNEMMESSLAYSHEYKYSDTLTSTIAFTYKIQEPKEAFDYQDLNTSYKSNDALDAQLTLNYNKNKIDSYYLSLAQKNRFASLVELYPFFPWDTPNTNVKPEESHSVEFGAQFSTKYDTIVKLSTYYNRVKNMIIYESNQYKNIAEADIKGFEINLNNYSFDNNDIEVSYAYTDALDKDGNRILYIPKSKLNLSDKISINSEISAVINYLYSSSIIDSYNSTRHTVDSYSLTDFQMVYSPSKELLLKAGIKNIFDKNWYYRYGQPAQGRNLFLSLKYTF